MALRQVMMEFRDNYWKALRIDLLIIRCVWR